MNNNDHIEIIEAELGMVRSSLDHMAEFARALEIVMPSHAATTLLARAALGVRSLKDVHKQMKMLKGDYWDEDGRCIHCGAGDDIHHSFTCPTNLHPDKRANLPPKDQK